MPIVWFLQQLKVFSLYFVFGRRQHALYWNDMLTRTRTQRGPGRAAERNLWDKIWRDEKGRLVIWQMPNAPLIAWAVLTFLSLLVNGKLADACYWLGSAALIIWAGLELFKGVNYFRRVLGLVVLIMALMSVINNLH